MREVEIRIVKGKMTIHTVGFTGPGCMAAVEGLKKLVGGEAARISEELTDEYYQTVQSVDHTLTQGTTGEGWDQQTW